MILPRHWETRTPGLEKKGLANRRSEAKTLGLVPTSTPDARRRGGRDAVIEGAGGWRWSCSRRASVSASALAPRSVELGPRRFHVPPLAGAVSQDHASLFAMIHCEAGCLWVVKVDEAIAFRHTPGVLHHRRQGNCAEALENSHQVRAGCRTGQISNEYRRTTTGSRCILS